ncbi:MAG: hypothetical protein OWU84_01615 [Firmicutes bacterium]|nr:hypothetical protein [Bacillota bacterium]
MVEPQDGLDLKALAEQIRRRPQLACDMDVSELAEWVRNRWRAYSDLLQSSEEVPTAAWIVRKKAEGLVRPEPSEEEPAAPVVGEARPAWVSQAAAALEAQAVRASRYLAGPPRGGPSSPRPVRGASPWTLAWSYPRLPPAPRMRTHVVPRRYDSLKEEMNQVLRHLQEDGSTSFEELARGQPWPRRVGQFLAIVHLWHQQRILVEQREAFGPLWLGLPREGAM